MFRGCVYLLILPPLALDEVKDDRQHTAPSVGPVAPQGTGLTMSDRMTDHDRLHHSQTLDQLDGPVPLLFAVYAARPRTASL
jgi:hypothetical protein